MISHYDLDNLPTPQELLGNRLFADLQDLLISIHRRGGSGVTTDQHPVLIMDGAGGIVAKVDRDLTRIISA